MRALVTGATGFIGSHLVEGLLKRGYEVSCLIRKTSDLRWLEGLDVKYIYGDCSDKESLIQCIRGFDYIFHLAGLTKASSKEDLYCINAKGTENLMEAVARNNEGVRRFVYLSSLSAFGPALNDKLPNEEMKPHPVSDYGLSKLKGEDAVLKYRDRVPVSILRPAAVYGPRDRDFFLFFKFVRKGILPNWGESRVSLVYVDDLVNAIILCGEKEKSIGETYFISDGMIYSSSEIINEIASAFQVRPTQVKLPKAILPVIAFFGEKVNRLRKKTTMINRDKVKEITYPNWFCDISKATRDIDFKPKTNIKEGIKWTADWYRIHRWL
ncbi:MAG: NAD-dependent epimerase/dehydratase family protein [Nitrospirae bacterium]|nr:NAD-dependent epimerase/dehydratase family protein [Nitrospirota bacterium]